MNDTVASLDSRQLHGSVQQGAETMQLVAEHGQIGPSGEVQRDHIELVQMTWSIVQLTTCGCLADAVDAYTIVLQDRIHDGFLTCATLQC